eukprot:SAG22_NODE_275_length_13171_cov_11.640606_2_plen_84_part_00
MSALLPRLASHAWQVWDAPVGILTIGQTENIMLISSHFGPVRALAGHVVLSSTAGRQAGCVRRTSARLLAAAAAKKLMPQTTE